MLEIYLLVTMLNGAPKIDVYPTEELACAAADVSPETHLYKETVNRRNEVALTEGSCKPFKRFVTGK